MVAHSDTWQAHHDGQGIPSAFNKDLQESWEAFTDYVKTVSDGIQIAKGVTLTTQPDKTAAAPDPFMLATDVTDILERRVALSQKTGTSMNELSYEQLKAVDVNYEKSVEMRSAKGGTGKSSVLEQIKVLKGMLDG